MTEPQRFPYSAAEIAARGGLPFLTIALLHGDQRIRYPLSWIRARP